jgi:hypothetical protein
MGARAGEDAWADWFDQPWDSPIPSAEGRVEVNARLIGDLPMREIIDAWTELGAFAFGHDDQDAAVIRFLIEGNDEDAACRSVTARLLDFDGIVPLDVRPGPYVAADDDAEGQADASLERRLDAFLDRLDPELQVRAFDRLLAHFGGSFMR